MPYGSGTAVLSNLTEIEQLPPISSRLSAVLSWSPVTTSLSGRILRPTGDLSSRPERARG